MQHLPYKMPESLAHSQMVWDWFSFQQQIELAMLADSPLEAICWCALLNPALLKPDHSKGKKDWGWQSGKLENQIPCSEWQWALNIGQRRSICKVLLLAQTPHGSVSHFTSAKVRYLVMEGKMDVGSLWLAINVGTEKLSLNCKACKKLQISAM